MEMDQDGLSMRGSTGKTWTPSASDIEWTRQMIASLKDGGVWAVPITGAIITVLHSEKRVKYRCRDLDKPLEETDYRIMLVLRKHLHYRVDIE